MLTSFVFVAPGAAAVLLARWWVARVLGMRGVHFFGGSIEDPAAAGAWRRVVVVLAGLVASYLLAGVLFAAALLVGGRRVSTTEVDVRPGSPAALAGMESGDRVTAVAGRPISSWDDLSGTVRRHPGEPIEVVVARGAGERRFTVTPESSPEGNAKIGVASVVKREPAGFVAAVGAAVKEPALVLVETGRGLMASFSGRLAVEMAGPVRIVGETAKAAQRGPGDVLHLVAALLAYVWPFSAILALASVPRRARAEGARKKR